MKKLKVKLIVMAIVCFGIAIICSCQKKDNQKIDFLENNLFNDILNNFEGKNEPIFVNKFSENLLPLNIEEFKIVKVENYQLSFEVKAGRFFVNSDEYLLDNKKFVISKIKDVYSISGDNSSLDVLYDCINNDFLIKVSNQIINITHITEEHITSEIEKDYIVQLILLHEFVEDRLMRNSLPHAYSSINFKSDETYEGSGIGFHLGLADAKHFCQADYEEILEENPDWWSPGISYSCIFGEHFCMCSANFYSDN